MSSILPRTLAALTITAAACAGAAVTVPPPPLVPGERGNEYVFADYPSLAYHVVDSGAVTVLDIELDAALESQHYALLHEDGHVLDGHGLGVGDVIADGAMRNVGDGTVRVQTEAGEVIELQPGRNLVIDAQQRDHCRWAPRCLCACGDDEAVIRPDDGDVTEASCEALNGRTCYTDGAFRELDDAVPGWRLICDEPDEAR